MAVVLSVLIMLFVFGYHIYNGIKDKTVSTIEKMILAIVTIIVAYNSIFPVIALACGIFVWHLLRISVIRGELLFLIAGSAIFALITSVFKMNFSYGSMRSSITLFMTLVTIIFPILIFIVRLKPSIVFCNTKSEAYQRIVIIWLSAFIFNKYIAMFLSESINALADSF
jgi:hypothetical protein